MAQKKEEVHGDTWRVPQNPTPQQYRELLQELNYFRDMYLHLNGMAELVVMQLEHISSQATSYSTKLKGAQRWCKSLRPPTGKK